jgi:RNA polymerase sigma-70 factor (ECF subfamily)
MSRVGGSEEPGDFTGWYAVTAPGVLLTLRAALGSDQLAEDAVAEAFTRAYSRWPKVRAMESRTGWVYVVALNYARTAARGRRRESLFEDVPARASDARPGPEPTDPVWEAVRQLAPSARMAIALRYIADLPEAEVARLMGVTRGTVATTLHRARRALAESLRVEQLGGLQ